MTMLIFVNKPLTILLYILGIFLIVLLSFQDGSKYFVACFWLIPAFSIFYFNALTYFYLLRGDEKFEIKGVDISAFKNFVRIYWVISLIGLGIGIFLSSETDSVLISAMFLVFYNAICAVLLKCAIYAKFFSLALKKNPNLKNFKVEDLYVDIREILLKKVIN